jgi:hypothetical protein
LRKADILSSPPLQGEFEKGFVHERAELPQKGERNGNFSYFKSQLKNFNEPMKFLKNKPFNGVPPAQDGHISCFTVWRQARRAGSGKRLIL